MNISYLISFNIYLPTSYKYSYKNKVLTEHGLNINKFKIFYLL